MDGRPPGNTGCCRLFFFFGLPSPLAPAPHPRKPHLPLAPRTPPRSERSPAFQPLAGWVAGAPTPAADLGCLRAAREPLRIRLPGNQRTGEGEGAGGGWGAVEGVLSVWGSLGRPQALPGGAPAPAPAPAPPPEASSQAASGSPAGVRTTHSHNHNTHSHTHTHTHTHTHPPPRKVKRRRPQVRETEKEGERDRQQEDHTDFQSPGRHTLPPPFWVPPGPQSTRPPPSPTDTLTHTLSRAHPLAWGRGLGLALGGQAEGDL